MGNTFHVPSVVLFLAMLFHLPYAPGPADAYQYVPGSWSDAHASQRIWNNDVLRGLAPPTTAAAVLDDMLLLFPHGFFCPHAVLEARARAGTLDITPCWASTSGQASTA